MKNYISININYLRDLNRLSQSEMGKIYGLSSNAVSTYERNIALPSIEFIQMVCKDNDVLIDDFINKDLSKIKKEAHFVQEPETKYQVAEKTIQLYEELNKTNQKIIEGKDATIATKDELIKTLNKTIEMQGALLNQADTLGKLVLAAKAELEIKKAEKEKNGH